MKLSLRSLIPEIMLLFLLILRKINFVTFLQNNLHNAFL